METVLFIMGIGIGITIGVLLVILKWRKKGLRSWGKILEKMEKMEEKVSSMDYYHDLLAEERMRNVHHDTINPLRRLDPTTIRPTGGGNTAPVTDKKHRKAGILIPQNLSEEEKQILRDFYGYMD